MNRRRLDRAPLPVLFIAVVRARIALRLLKASTALRLLAERVYP